MRQVGDTLVWLALIVMVVAVLYFTPRVASYVSSREKVSLREGWGGMAWRAVDDDRAEEPAEEVR